jgi:hypothetical protein
MAIGINGHLGSSQLPFGLFLGHLAQILQLPVQNDTAEERVQSAPFDAAQPFP